MIKKKIIILFLLVFAMSFSAQYKITKGKSVKMIQQEMQEEAKKFEEVEKFLNSKESKKEGLEEIKKTNREILKGEEFYIIQIMDGILNLTMQHKEIKITEINFISNKKVKILFQIKVPRILTWDEDVVDKDIDNEIDRRYIKRYGKVITDKEIKKMSKSEQKKVADRALTILEEIVNEKIKSKTMKYDISNDSLTFVEVNREWEME